MVSSKETRRLSRPLGLGLAWVGVAMIGTSLVPDPAPWAHIAGCAGCSYDAFSGPPGFVILPLAVFILVVSVVTWTARDRWIGAWKPLFLGGLGVTVMGAGTLVALQVMFGDASAAIPEGARGLFFSPNGGSPMVASYGPWLALGGGAAVMLGALLLRASAFDVAATPQCDPGDLIGWSPAVIAGGSLAVAGGVAGAFSMAAVSGAQTGAIFVPYLGVAVLVGLSRSALIWRPAAALALVGALLFLGADVVLGYDDGLIRLGASVAALGSGLALFAPITSLRAATEGAFGTAASTRIVTGAGLILVAIAGIAAIGILSGQTF